MNIIIKRSRRQSVSLKITTDGNLQINCPLLYSDAKIEKLIESKQNWITKALLNVKNKQLTFAEFYNYKKVMYLGISYNVEIYENKIKIGENIIKYKKFSSAYNAIKKWLYKSAQDLILSRLQIISRKCNLSYKSAKIISARKKWGSCSNTKEIRLNFRMIMLNMECIDYICIHELCHLKQMNHSKKFWDMVNFFMPNYKEVKKDITKNSFILELF